MTNLRAALTIVAIVLAGIFIILIVLIEASIITVPSYFFGPAVFWSAVNGIATVTFTTVAVVNMIELRRSRMELVRPRLSLEPAFFEYDTKSGNIIGFNSLNLVNGGTVARDVDIDFSCKGKTDLLYVSSIGEDRGVQIWTGKFSELGGNLSVDVKYRTMYNRSLHEVLSMDIDSITSAKRKIVPVHSIQK